MSEFNFKGSEVEITKPEGGKEMVNYAKPDIHDLQVTSWELKKATTGSLFIDMGCTNPSGEVVNRQYWMNTIIGVGKTKSAFQISRESLKKFAIGIGKEAEYNAVEAHSEEEFSAKMSAIFIMAKFRNKVKGKQVEKQDGGRFIKAEMSDAFESISIPKSESKLRFDPVKDIKMLPAKAENFSASFSSGAGEIQDLPF